MEVNTAILATGGIDSTVLMYDAVHYHNRYPTIITVDYGQDVFHIQEKMLNHHIKELGLDDLVVIRIEFPKETKQPGLFKKGYVPTKKDGLNDLRYEEFYVEGRNAAMLLNAMMYCSVHKIDELQTGYLYSKEEWDNRRSYKMITGDNSPHFVDILNLLSLVGFSHQMRIRAPFYELHYDKADVVSRGREFGIDLENWTYSCYFDPPCGKCDNCELRKNNLETKE